MLRSENAEISAYSTLAQGKNVRTVSKIVDVLPTDWIIYNELLRVRKNVQVRKFTWNFYFSLQNDFLVVFS